MEVSGSQPTMEVLGGGPMSLFLDANAYLNLYRLSDDDLGELEKLVAAVEAGRTLLYLTEQVQNEFARNRARTISDSLDRVEGAKLPTSFPRLITNLPGYAPLRSTLDEFEAQRKELVAEAQELARKVDLQADRLIGTLFKIATSIPLTDEVVTAARKRHDLGNPPGKKDSMGDAVNWESLMASVPHGEDLVVVTGDSDFASKLDEASIDEFLGAEWREQKSAEVSLQRTLSSLFKTYYPEIRLAADFERERAIDSLIASPDFRSTHLAIQTLSDFPEFNREQVRALADAALANSQVHRILSDRDVREFYQGLMSRYSADLEPGVISMLNDLMGPEPEDENN